ncbi:MAG TPA: hypothetical protein VGH42_01010 [Verrucomicrobiae bacterium]|jgi:hypothetical protein
MKTNPAAKFSLFAILFVAASFIAGCATTPSVDWNSRVGTYTLDQAVTDLGPPDKQAKSSDGKSVVEWITYRSAATGFSADMNYVNGPAGAGAAQSAGKNYSDRVLRLTFGPDGKLVSWWKNY